MENFAEILRRVFAPSREELQDLEKVLQASIPRSKRVRLENEIRRAYDNPPRIAVIGTTGVGKTSTVNALFSPQPPLPIGHVTATTKNPKRLKVNLGQRGSIVVIDYPGLNESIEANKRVIPLYRRLLASCDVAVYVFQATDKTFADDQELLKRILTKRLKQRLVIGINQIDLIQPGLWIEEYNLPSKEQEESINSKVKDVRKKLKEIDLAPRFIVPYSAKRGYRLTHLFSAMLQTCPENRAWVLGSREKIVPYQSPALAGSRV